MSPYWRPLQIQINCIANRVLTTDYVLHSAVVSRDSLSIDLFHSVSQAVISNM